MSATANNRMSSCQLQSLLNALSHEGDENWADYKPNLEPLRLAVGVDSLCFVPVSAVTGPQTRLDRGLSVECCRGTQKVGTLQVGLSPGRLLADETGEILGLVADRLAVEAVSFSVRRKLAVRERVAEANRELVAIARQLGDVDTLLRKIPELVANIARPACVDLYLLKEQRLIWESGSPEAYRHREQSVPVGHGLIGRVAECGLPLFDEGEGNAQPEGPGREVHWALPLTGSEGLSGVLSLIFSGDGAYAEVLSQPLLDFCTVADALLQVARVSRKLGEERTLFESIVGGAPNGVIVVDRSRRVVLMNNVACSYFPHEGCSDLRQAAPIEDYLPQAAFTHRLNRVLNGISERESLDLMQGAGAHRRDYHINIYALQRGEARAACLIVTDRTEQRKLDEQVMRIGRVASLGQLAAGIAHEIRNPLTGVGITLEILREEEGLSAAGQEMISDIGREIDRLEGVVHGLLDFARPQPVQHRPMQLAKTLDWHRTFREQCRNKGVECVLEMETNPRIQGDPERLKQLFLNLAINALDATDPGGTITLRARSGDRPHCTTVEVSDTGRGMDKETVQRIFDPFFTTKNEGTGLGLSIANSIVEQHGGHIEVDSTPGKGTTFRVELPTSESAGSKHG